MKKWWRHLETLPAIQKPYSPQSDTDSDNLMFDKHNNNMQKKPRKEQVAPLDSACSAYSPIFEFILA